MMERLWGEDFSDINTNKMGPEGCWRTYCDLCCRSLVWSWSLKRGTWWEKHEWDVWGEQVGGVIRETLKGPFWSFSVKLITHSRGRNLQREMSPIMLIQGKIWPWDPFHSYKAMHGHLWHAIPPPYFILF